MEWNIHFQLEVHYGENSAPIISLICVNAKGVVPIKMYKSKEQTAYEIKIPDTTKVYLVVNGSLEVKFTVEQNDETAIVLAARKN